MRFSILSPLGEDEFKLSEDKKFSDGNGLRKMSPEKGLINIFPFHQFDHIIHSVIVGRIFFEYTRAKISVNLP